MAIKLTNGTIHHFSKCADKCHADASNKSVIRFAITRLKPGVWNKISRSSRKEAMQAIINRHAKNSELYAFVMNGR